MRSFVLPLLVAAAIGGCSTTTSINPPQTYEINGQVTRSHSEASDLIAERGTVSAAEQIIGATPPRLVRSVAPVMPADAIAREIVGNVTVELLVEADGRVSRVRVLSSPHDLLSRAVVQAMEQWIFTPLVRDGSPIRFTVRQTYAFRVSS